MVVQDGLIRIAVGDSRKSVYWRNKELTWSQLVDRLKTPTRTPETLQEYHAMPKAKRDEIKDIGGFVGGQLNNQRRKATSVLERHLLTLDIDNVPRDFNPWDVITIVLGCAAIMYSTHSHTADKPRYRLLVPLKRPVTPDEYQAIARRVAGDIGIEYMDQSTYEVHRLMYWPSSPIDGPYVFEVENGPWLDPDDVLNRYHNWRNPDEWPRLEPFSKTASATAKKQGDPREKPGIIGAFCRVYDVPAAIQAFLRDVYVEETPGRYSYKKGSTTGGLALYEHDLFAYSHHSSDPASGQLVNAYDLVRIHKFGDLDDEAKPDTPIHRLPSTKAMAEFASEIPEVKEDVALKRLEEVKEALNEDFDSDWLKDLSITPKGQIEETIDNILKIILNDPSLAGAIKYDEFRARALVVADLPWQKVLERATEVWTDADDAGLTRHLEAVYGLYHPKKTRDAFDLALLRLAFHPVRDYLRGLEWDGQRRLESLFIDYLGAEDSIYTREVTRKALLGAVARVMEPGCKHDHMLVLVGPQGCRKSTTLMKLGKSWFSDSLYTVAGKEAYELIQGTWIIELGEMAATRKAELEQIKQFISKQVDTYRAAYAKRTVDYPRQCAFFGTTNDDEFLRDPTGARRFWPVVVTDKGRYLGQKLTEFIIDQVWAEAFTYYRKGEKWHLSDETERLAAKEQAKHTEQDFSIGLIQQFLDMPVPENWLALSLSQRLDFYQAQQDGLEEGTMLRDRICALEIWQELFRGRPKDFNRARAREINATLRQLENWTLCSSAECGKIYGRQRGFMRSNEPDL